jgi:hypothetical protein
MPFKQQFLDIAEASTEPKVQPHGVAHDFDRKAMVLVGVSVGEGIHVATLTHCVGAQQLDNANQKPRFC